nr:13151_t:CDS:1 [Entrophospora candida]
MDKHGQLEMKNPFTCGLTIPEDGTKLPPTVVFNGKQFTSSNYHGNDGWMDKIGIKLGLIRCRITKKALFIMYSFKVHKTDPIKKIAQDENADLEIIQGSSTLLLQQII